MFQPIQFLFGTTWFVILPTAIGIAIIAREMKKREKRSELRSIIGPAFTSYLLGIITAALWLSWNDYHSISDTFQIRPPAEVSIWQVIACGITLAICSASLSKYRASRNGEAILFSLLLASGLSTVMSFGVSFGVGAQEGVGVIFSFMGAILVSAVFGLIARATVKSDSPK
ncbi:hypothetical protein [Corynebacterium sp. CCM 9203]|uniref:hypothetical protein n=1 Tax=Corynebacterium sp. CCM 9203 TaxID=3057615 RepID=UPI003525D9A4